MAKAKPFSVFMKFETTISNNDARFAADCLVDSIFDDYSQEAIEAVGIRKEALIDEVMTMPEFRKMLAEAFETYGTEATESPYDYCDFYTVTDTKPYLGLYRALDVVDQILQEADIADSYTDCNAAIETLKRAGFKIVKA